MPDQALVRNSLSRSVEKRCCEAEVEDKRRHNREFMRRWRADPFHLAAEKAKRRERYYAVQKQRKIEHESCSPRVREQTARLYGFCFKRAAVRKIVRLRISENAPDGYVKVRIPYCGHC